VPDLGGLLRPIFPFCGWRRFPSLCPTDEQSLPCRIKKNGGGIKTPEMLVWAGVESNQARACLVLQGLIRAYGRGSARQFPRVVGPTREPLLSLQLHFQ